MIFDVDGTLVSLKVDGVRLRTVIARELERSGFDMSFFSMDLYTQEIIDGAKSQVDAGRVKVDFEALRGRLYGILDSLEMEWSSESRPIDGVEDVLSQLRGRSVSLAALTNSGRVPARTVLQRYALEKYFELVLTRDEVPAMKPSPDGILRALELMGLGRDEAIYVGDSGIDVRAARGAGVKVASVTTGHYTAERFVKEGTDYVLATLSDLLPIVQNG